MKSKKDTKVQWLFLWRKFFLSHPIKSYNAQTCWTLYEGSQYNLYTGFTGLVFNTDFKNIFHFLTSFHDFSQIPKNKQISSEFYTGGTEF